MKKTWFNGYVQDFSVDYDATDVDDIKDICKYLMKNYPFSIKTSKCSGNCNNINDPYAKICVPHVVKKHKR